MSFRFLHMADVHLDTPFQNRDPQIRRLLREAVRQAFANGVKLALAQRVHAVLIAGDLFDNNTLSFATERFLLEQFTCLKEAGIRVFYAPGNHDPYGASYRLAGITWPENLHVFTTREPTTVPVPDGAGRPRALITGAGHEGVREAANLAKAFPPAAAGVPQIGLLHTLVGGATGATEHDRYAPCSLDDLREKGYTYWALGHIHTGSRLLEEPLTIYPGNIMGRNPREDGPKGAYLVEIDDQGKPKATFHALAPVCWATLRIGGLAAAGNLESLERHLQAAVAARLEEGGYQGRLFLRVILEGPSPLYRELQNEENLAALTDDLQGLLRLEYLELVTENVTRPVNPDSFRNEPHLLSAALDLLDALKTDDELLLKLKPEHLAGHPGGGGRRETLTYLRSLLPGLDCEATARLLQGERG